MYLTTYIRNVEKHALCLKIEQEEDNTHIIQEIDFFPTNNDKSEKVIELLKTLKKDIETIIMLLSDTEVIE